MISIIPRKCLIDKIRRISILIGSESFEVLTTVLKRNFIFFSALFPTSAEKILFTHIGWQCTITERLAAFYGQI